MKNGKNANVVLADEVLEVQLSINTVLNLVMVLQEAYLSNSQDSLKEDGLVQYQWIAAYDKIDALVTAIFEKIVFINDKLHNITENFSAFL